MEIHWHKKENGEKKETNLTKVENIHGCIFESNSFYDKKG